MIKIKRKLINKTLLIIALILSFIFINNIVKKYNQRQRFEEWKKIKVMFEKERY